MNNPNPNLLREMPQSFNLTGAAALGNSLGQPRRVKVFKSGNSLAVRMPKALGLEAGMELEVTLSNDGSMVLRKAEPAKRKFNIDKVWGCAIGSGLQPIDEDDRWFAERPLLWDDPEWGAKHMPDA